MDLQMVSKTVESNNRRKVAAFIAMLHNVSVFRDELKVHILNMVHRITQQEVIIAGLRRGIEIVSEI